MRSRFSTLRFTDSVVSPMKFCPRRPRRAAVHGLAARAPRALAALATSAALCAASATADAQSEQPMQGMGAVPSLALDPDTTPRVEGTRVPGNGNWNVGAVLQ